MKEYQYTEIITGFNEVLKVLRENRDLLKKQNEMLESMKEDIHFLMLK